MASSDPTAGSSNNASPGKNPVLTAYEGFVRDTPLVSRYIVTIYAGTWVMSFFINPIFAVSNTPYFSVMKFEVYRIVLSPFYCNNIIALALAYFSFIDHGKRLEFSLGSTQFGWLALSLSCLANIGHIVLCFVLGLLTKDNSWLFVPAGGIWMILFPMIAIDCAKSPAGSMRRFIVWNIHALYYPMVLVVIFSFLGESALNISYIVAAGVGYAYGFNKLEWTKISNNKAKQWEDTILVNFIRQEGWVVGHAATGSDAWNDLGSDGGGGPNSGGTAPGLGGFFRSSAGNTEQATLLGRSTNAADSFPSGGGRQLGSGPTQRARNADARAARLKALEGNNNINNTKTGKEGEENV